MVIRFNLIICLIIFGTCANAADTKDPSLTRISQQELKKRIAQTPLDSPAQILLISQAKSSHLTQQAYDQYLLIWRAHPKDVYANLLAGMAAERNWASLTSPTTGTLKPYDPLARTLLDQSRRCLSEAAQMQPMSAKINMEYGYFLWKYDNAATAGFPFLQKAVQMTPKDPVGHALLGEALSNPYIKFFSPSRAKSELETAIKLNPVYAYPHLELVFFYLQQNGYKEAQAQMEKYLNLSPADVANEKIIKILQAAIDKGTGKS